MPVEVIDEKARRKGAEGDEYLPSYFQPRRWARPPRPTRRRAPECRRGSIHQGNGMGEDVFIIGSGTMLPVFAEAGVEHSRKYGTTFEQFAKDS